MTARVYLTFCLATMVVAATPTQQCTDADHCDERLETSNLLQASTSLTKLASAVQATTASTPAPTGTDWQWVETENGRYCTNTVTLGIKNGMDVDSCGNLAAGNSKCNNQIISVGITVCKCAKSGDECDTMGWSVVYSVYKLRAATPAPTAAYVMIGSELCFLPILSAKDCGKAAKALGLADTTAYSTANTGQPGGCLVGSQGQLLFNTQACSSCPCGTTSADGTFDCICHVDTRATCDTFLAASQCPSGEQLIDTASSTYCSSTTCTDTDASTCCHATVYTVGEIDDAYDNYNGWFHNKYDAESDARLACDAETECKGVWQRTVDSKWRLIGPGDYKMAQGKPNYTVVTVLVKSYV